MAFQFLHRFFHRNEKEEKTFIRVLHAEPRYERHHILLERRYAQSPFLPLLFLLLELLLIALVIYSVGQFHILWLDRVILGGGIFYFVVSSLPRFWMILHRQKRHHAAG